MRTVPPPTSERGRHAAADGDDGAAFGVAAVRNLECGDGAEDFIGEDLGGGRVGVGQDDDELFATVACEEVAGALDGGLDTGGDGAEAVVADLVPVRCR